MAITTSLQRLSGIRNLAAEVAAKIQGKPMVTKYSSGIPYNYHVKTGTEVLNANNFKSIALGQGNRLNSELGIRNIVSYNPGVYGPERHIVVFGANNKPLMFGSPQEFGEYTRFTKDFVNALKA